MNHVGVNIRSKYLKPSVYAAMLLSFRDCTEDILANQVVVS